MQYQTVQHNTKHNIIVTTHHTKNKTQGNPVYAKLQKDQVTHITVYHIKTRKWVEPKVD
jgi:hypothetical protein